MADAALPIKRHHTKKPPKGKFVSVNKGHPLARGLKNFIAGRKTTESGNTLQVDYVNTFTDGINVQNVATTVNNDYLYDATNDFIEFNTSIQPTTDFTIIVKFSPVVTGANRWLWANWDTGSADQSQVFWLDSSSTYRSRQDDTSADANLLDFGDASTTHIAVSYRSGGNHTVFADGVQAGQTACGTLETFNTGFYLGNTNNETDGWNGTIEYLMIYDRELSPAEVKAIYDNAYQVLEYRTHWIDVSTTAAAASYIPSPLHLLDYQHVAYLSASLKGGLQ